MTSLRFSTAAAVLTLAGITLFANGNSGAGVVNFPTAIRQLKNGNDRFVGGDRDHRHQDAHTRETTAKGQKPFAIVLTCADSRLSPELIFDQGLGDLFVLRVAGNTADPAIIGSMEYAVEHLGSKLVVVMGHERCGAVDAALKGGHVHGALASVVYPIAPAVKATNLQPGDRLKNAVCENVRMTIKKIRKQSKVVGGVKIVGAYYDLDEGKVTWL